MIWKTEIGNYEKHFCIIGQLGFGRKKKIYDFSFFEKSSRKRLSTDTPMKELDYVVLKKSEFQHPAKSNGIAFFWHASITEEDVPAKNFRKIIW